MSDKFIHPDLRRLMAEKPNFSASPQTLDSFFLHHNHLTRGFSPVPPPPLLPKFQPLHLVLTDHAGLPDGGMLQYACADNSGSGGGGGGGSSTVATAVSADQFLRRNKMMDSEWWPYGNDVVGGSSTGVNCRWPRQETLTLLEIRSRLDSKFKESNQKGPLWDQVSRMMAEEYGYKRSGKKCKEKFDNLYKYYKKTKEGKTGRHDGKHYRFFRQLEAIYGECNDVQLSSPIIESNFYRSSAPEPNLPTEKFPGSQTTHNNNNNNNNQKPLSGAGMSLSFSVSSDFETSSSGNYHDDDLSAIAFMMRQRSAEKVRENDASKGDGRRGGWRDEVEKMVESKMSRLMEVQENWMEKIMASVEDGEKERILKEEEWRKQDLARFDREMVDFCARERAWVEAREAALMEIVKKFAG